MSTNLNAKKIINENSEIDVSAVFSVLYSGKKIIFALGVVGALISIVFSNYLPNKYKAFVLLAPTEENSTSSGTSALNDGLAALTGGSIQKTTNKTTIALEIMQSRKFIADFVERHDIIVPLMAIKSWDAKTKTIKYHEDIYDINQKKWALGNKPSRMATYSRFNSLLNIKTDSLTGIINVDFEFPVPRLAYKWLVLLVHDLNYYSKTEDIEISKKGMTYLQKQLLNTEIVELKNVLYMLIQNQIQNTLLAETIDEYVLKTIDPAVVPEYSSFPNHKLIVLLGTFLFFFIGVLLVLVRNYKRYHNQ